MRTIPPALKAHLDGHTTTTCRLLKITLKDGQIFGLTTLDKALNYDDGVDGEIKYSALNGFDPSVMSADVGYAVPNAEGYSLLKAQEADEDSPVTVDDSDITVDSSLITADAGISEDIPGITLEMAEAGDLDDAQWVMYLVNYEDLSMGHVLLDAGDLGDVRTKFGFVWIPELLSYIMRLRQPIGSVWSRKCRAIFGTPADSQTGCGVDISTLWVNGEVEEVGAESDRSFTGSDITAPGGVEPNPGRLQWLTGRNAGREFAIEGLEDDNVVLLVETTPYIIEVGDTYRIRPDCAKRYIEDCIGVWANGPNFKGEPLIPTGDASAVQAPGAQLPGMGAWNGPTLPWGSQDEDEPTWEGNP